MDAEATNEIEKSDAKATDQKTAIAKADAEHEATSGLDAKATGLNTRTRRTLSNPRRP